MKIGELKREVDDLSKKLDQLSAKVDERFAQVDARFAQVDARFAQVDARFAQVDARFAQVDARFAQVDARFDTVDARFTTLEQKMLEDGQTTRRHMDMLYERFKTDQRLVLDQWAATTTALSTLTTLNTAEHAGFVTSLDNHEARLQAVERHTP